MYPIFITDDPDSEEEIPSLPLQKRYSPLEIALTPQVGCEQDCRVSSSPG